MGDRAAYRHQRVAGAVMTELYADQVKRVIGFISPAVAEAADECGLPATLDALSTILLTLLITTIGGDKTRTTIGCMYQEVARLEGAMGITSQHTN
jgi:hypothetical protein